jgi:hypothetical protein
VQDTAAYTIGNTRREPAQPGVLAIGADAGDELHVVVLQRLEKLRYIRRVVLQVGVEGDHDAATGMAKARRERGALSRVARQAERP